MKARHAIVSWLTDRYWIHSNSYSLLTYRLQVVLINAFNQIGHREYLLVILSITSWYMIDFRLFTRLQDTIELRLLLINLKRFSCFLSMLTNIVQNLFASSKITLLYWMPWYKLIINTVTYWWISRDCTVVDLLWISSRTFHDLSEYNDLWIFLNFRLNASLIVCDRSFYQDNDGNVSLMAFRKF